MNARARSPAGFSLTVVACLTLLVSSAPAVAGPRVAQNEPGEPPLPDGLDGGLDDGLDDGEPALPAGLDGSFDDGSGDGEPALPDGLLDLVGFTELRGGARFADDPLEQRATLGELRTEIAVEKFLLDRYTIKLTADFLVDTVDTDRDYGVDGEWRFLDLREAYLAFSPVSFADIKIGRQIMTWGTGDLVFVNDLFPKDWRSTLLGRDIAYLKAPSDAAKLSLFSRLANLDLIYVPRFNADRFITGDRISYYNPILGERAGSNAIADPDLPDVWFEDHEFHARLSKNIDSAELALYTYRGSWKSPAGVDPMTLRPVFPELSVHGGSIRDLLGDGVAVLEVAYYDSREDRTGDDFWINNSEVRLLAGYERRLPELSADLTIGFQYYLELMVDYFEYRSTYPSVLPQKDQFRHVFTARVHKLLLNQDLQVSLFGFYSPSDQDGYIRPRLAYKVDDYWRVSVGGNIFVGRHVHTFFNQFANNSNLYTAIRYSF